MDDSNGSLAAGQHRQNGNGARRHAPDDAAFLREIRGLYERGEVDDALDLLNGLLMEQPDAAEVRLLKAELCMGAGRCHEFLGAAAAEYRARAERSEREQAVIDGAVKQANRALDEARSKLRRPYVADAMACLKKARALVPWDAGVSLASALMLYNVLVRVDDEEASSDGGFSLGGLLPDLLSRLEARSYDDIHGGKVMDAIKEALHRTRELAAPDEAPWRGATSALAAIYTSEGNHEQAIALLREAEQNGLDMAERLAALEENLSGKALSQILARVQQMMRQGNAPQAAPLLAACLEAAPDHAAPWLALAEWLTLRGNVEAVESIYRWLMARERVGNPMSREGAANLRALLEATTVPCARCGKPLAPEDQRCRVCECPVGARDTLLGDRLQLGNLPPNVAAAVGLAVLLDQAGRYAEALPVLDAVLNELPEGHTARAALQDIQMRLKPLQAQRDYEDALGAGIAAHRAGDMATARERFTQLLGGENGGDRALAWLALTPAADDGLTDENRDIIRRAMRVAPDVWAATPAAARHRLARAVLDAGWLKEAHSLLDAVYTESQQATRRVGALRALYAKRMGAECDRLAAAARRELAAGQPDRALRVAEEALRGDPLHAGALLARGEANLANNLPYLAAADFEAAHAAVPDDDVRAEAVLGLSRTYVALGSLRAALETLNRLPAANVEAQKLRTVLENRRANQPAVHLARMDSAITADTLRRVPEPHPYTQAVFAIAIRAAARWHPGDPLAASQGDMLRAGHDFVATLGGLAGTLGYPAFELRLIATPNPDAPIQGRLTLALLCRVTHAIPERAEQLALELWRKLKPHLPLAGEFLYDYEPIYDEEELEWLLAPFEVRSGADLLRREALEDGHYAVQPFTTGGTTLRNLVDLLLRRDAPAMVSIHLQPTEMLPWERTALTENLAQLRRMRLPAAANGNGRLTDKIALNGDDEMNTVILPDGHRITLVEMLTQVQENLHKQPFIMRVSAASPAPNDAMLAHAVATELFGPGGRCEVVQPTEPSQLEAFQRNLREPGAEAWAESRAPETLARLRVLVSEVEAAWVFRLPMPGVEGIPGLPKIDIKAAPPTRLPAEGIVLGESLAAIGGARQPIRIRQIDRRRHVYVVGKTGVGKSTLLETMALQDIEDGRGVAVLDPHGDLVESILTRIPPERADDVIVFDPSDEERPVGLNFLQAETDSQRHRIVTEFIDMLMRFYDPKQMGIVGPRFQHNLRNAMLTVMLGDPRGTLIEVVRALTDSKFVKVLLPRVTDPMVRNYWEKQIANTADFHKSEVLDYIVSKFNRFVGDRLVRNIVGQSASTLDFRGVMDARQILLVNLSKGKIGPESASFLGFLLLQSLLIAALSRADQGKDRREDFCLYVDEFQTFATESFEAMLSEGRKYGMCLVMANQYMSQLPQELQQAVFGNVGSLVAFQVGVEDAPKLAPEFYPVFSSDDLLNIPRYTTATRLLVDGIATRPFAMCTRLVERLPDHALAERIRQSSRLRFGRDVRDVEAEIGERLKVGS